MNTDSGIKTLVAGLACLGWLSLASAQSMKTWNGSVSADWFNANNWTPAGVPATNDTINFSGGTISLTAPVAIYGQFNWSGGTLAGNPLTIATSGQLNVTSGNDKALLCVLTNAGTVTWSGGRIIVDNAPPWACGDGHNGWIENLAGGLFDIQSDQAMLPNYNCGAGTGALRNSGTVRKSTTMGTTTLSIPIYNPGTVTVLEGTLSFNAGGTVEGTLGAPVDRSIMFSGGNFTNTMAPVIPWPNSVQLTGGNLLLLNDAIPAMALVGGTVSLGSSFQGGTITNLTLSGSTLSGNYTVNGLLNWSAGRIIGGPLLVATNGLLNVTGGNDKSLLCALTNAGTVTWSGGRIIVDNAPPWACGDGHNGWIENLAGGLFDIQSDQAMLPNYNCGAGTGALRNSGTVRKWATTGTTTFSIPFGNSGLLSVLQGTLFCNGGGTIEGTVNASTGALVNYSGGSFTSAIPAVVQGPGLVQFTGGSLILLNDLVPNLGLLGGTVSLGPSFQGGSITNLTLSGSTLSGNYTLSGLLNWSAGVINGGSLLVASNGLVNLSGAGSKWLLSPLTNAGTVIWSGGQVIVDNTPSWACGDGHNGWIENLAGALFDIESDQAMHPNYTCGTGIGALRNGGTVRKWATAGTTSISIPFSNNGLVEVLQGTIALSGGFIPTGGTLEFGMSGASSFGQLSISGSASLDGTLAAVWLGGFVPALTDTFPVVMYGSHTGMFTNLDLPAPALWQTNYGSTSFSLTVASVSRLVFTAAPASTNAGAILAPAVVQVQDATGVPIATNGMPVTISVASGGGTLGGTTTRNTDASGKVTFDDLSMSQAGVKTLRASASGGWLTPATSGSFTIIATPAAQLVLVVPIASPQAAGAAFSPVPVVRVQDQFGNAVSNSTASITAKVSSSGGGSLGGATNLNADGSNGSASFGSLRYNLANPGAAESVVIYFSSPGLASVTNSAVMVDLALSSITLHDRNAVVQIVPTNSQGVLSWTVDGAEQLYQHWFWLGLGSNAPQSSFDTLGTPWGLAYNSSNAVLNYFAQGLSVQLGFTLQGGADGSQAAALAETLTVQNNTNAPISLHLFEYCDFDLANAFDGDAVSWLAPQTMVQQGKGMRLTETIQSPLPSFWEVSHYAFTLDELEGAVPMTLSDSFVPPLPGDQTFALQWDATLGPGQNLTLNTSKAIGPIIIPLSIASSGPNVVISWTTNGSNGLQLESAATLQAGGGVQYPVGGWSADTNVPVVVGEQYQVSVPQAVGPRYYRLAR